MQQYATNGCAARHIGAIAAMAVLLLAAPLSASQDFVPISHCGVRADSSIVEVTTTDPWAPGGLLAALHAPSPKIITFSVGGIITLDQDLEILTPFTTIAGETAPEPGIDITGATLRIRSHDICVRHLSIRPGPSESPQVNSTRDGVAIGGNPRKYGGAIERVLLENVSVSWGIDENISVWYAGTNSVQIRSAIIAEGLLNAGHPKGAHSKGLLVASDVTGVSISSSIFAHNNDRNPRISPNSQVSIEENLIYNPGNMSTEIFLNCGNDQHPLEIVRNLYFPGPNTKKGLPQYIFVDAQTRKHIKNRLDCKAGFAKLKLIEADIGKAKQIYNELLRHAGSRPSFRNANDFRIISEIRGRTGHIRDAAPAGVLEGSLPRQSGHVFVMPKAPLRREANGQLAIANALCRAHLKVGGLPFRGCSQASFPE